MWNRQLKYLLSHAFPDACKRLTATPLIIYGLEMSSQGFSITVFYKVCALCAVCLPSVQNVNLNCGTVMATIQMFFFESGDEVVTHYVLKYPLDPIKSRQTWRPRSDLVCSSMSQYCLSTF